MPPAPHGGATSLPARGLTSWRRALPVPPPPLQYLHDSGILHGDLKGHNVLLKSVRTDKRGYVAKLCDFGLSRLIGELQTHVDTGSYGTAT